MDWGGTSLSFALASLIFTFASARVHGQEAEPDCYKRGDANSDGQVSLTNASLIIDFLFYNPNGVMPFACELAANVGGPDLYGTMNINIADPNLVISSLFLTGTQLYEIPPPVCPPEFPGVEFMTEPCASYDPVPPAASDVIVEIETIDSLARDDVDVTVYVTSDEPIDAMQLFIKYDPGVFLPSEEETTFDGTIYEGRSHVERPNVLTSMPEAGVCVVGLSPQGFRGFQPIPAGDRVPIIRFTGSVQPGAPVGLSTIRLTNGPDGTGFGHEFLKNEISINWKPEILTLDTQVEGGVHVRLNVNPECFLRGDANSDGHVSLSDTSPMLRYQFCGGRLLDCLHAADTNSDGKFDVADIVWLLGEVFLYGPQSAPAICPPEPLGGGGSIVCEYNPTPPGPSAVIVELEAIEAAPGEDVDVAVFVTSSEPIDTAQLIVEYDPEVFIPFDDGVTFEGTYFEGSDSEPFVQVRVVGDSVCLVGLVPGLVDFSMNNGDPCHAIPAGDRVPVLRFTGRTLESAPEGFSPLRLTNGPTGDGTMVGPRLLKNEVSVNLKSEYLVLDNHTAGGMRVSADIIIFVRGDANLDSGTDMTDAILVLEHLFLGRPEILRCQTPPMRTIVGSSTSQIPSRSSASSSSASRSLRIPTRPKDVIAPLISSGPACSSDEPIRSLPIRSLLIRYVAQDLARIYLFSRSNHLSVCLGNEES